MDACVDIAIDRHPDDIVASFVEPLAIVLEKRGVGNLVRYSSDELWVHVDLELSDVTSMEHVLQFLAEADGPVGSVIYRLDERGQKQDIFVWAPPPDA